MKLSHVRLLAIGCSARAWHRSTPLPNSAAFSCGDGIRFGRRGNRYSTNMSRGRRRPTAVGTGLDTGLQGSQQDEVHNRGGVGKLKIIYDEVFLKHRPPPGHPHPECPARVSTARSELDRLEGIEWATPSSLRSEKGRERTLAAIERVHNPEYLEEVRRVCAKGGGAADFDTYICPDTFEVCIAASSAWMDAAESAAGGSPAFALARPPGHHATAGVGMGFCLVCFAAVAAFYALDALGCGRVAMLDFDVHHGNGVAALVKGDARIRYCSIHQGGIFPGSGGAEDSGPLGNLKHLPFFGVDETWETYEPRFEEAVEWLEEFKPDLVLVSAGYDALEADELATASLQPKDYGRMGKRLKEVFGSKVAFGLEGGYNLQNDQGNRYEENKAHWNGDQPSPIFPTGCSGIFRL